MGLGFDKGGNIKVGRIWTFSKLATNREFSVDGCKVKGSCKYKYCKGCRESCYVLSSYRFPSVVTKHAANTKAMREDIDSLFTILWKQLNNAKNKPETVRINQSGELESATEFSNWCILAGTFPKTNFYLYTKAFDIVIPELTERYENGTLPENITILFSVWHKYGIKEFQQVKHIPNVKAFAYCDGFPYGDYNLPIDTTCKAYESGRLNHDITCDKCKKCFNRYKYHKIIGCNNH